MEFSVNWSWFAVFSCLLSIGCGARNCTEEGLQMQGGDYSLTKGLSRGSTAIYNCPEDYYPYPDLIRVCQQDGNWNPRSRRPSQRCRLVECPDPNVLENGNVSPAMERYFVHNETTFECYSGYTMRGSRRRVCLPNGKWSGHTTICSRDSGDVCADPGIPPGASRLGNVFGIDDKVKYTCNGKLFLVGSEERTCQENGHWTGKDPQCYYKHTYDTPLEVSQAFGSAIEQNLATLQPLDDTQAERKIRIAKNETLNIYIAVDISASITPEEVSDAKDAVTKLITKISSFTVTPNYDVIFFSAEIHEVVSILNVLDDGVNGIKEELKKFKIDGKNTEGTDLNLAFKHILERMAVIKRRVTDKTFREHRHVLIFFTDGGFNMGGSPAPTVEQIKNMVYMNHTLRGETPVREDFLDIYIFGIGAQILDDDLRPLTAGVGGEHYFRMKNISNLHETFDKMIDESNVKGLCGLHREYGNQTKTELRRMYPWWTYIVVQNQVTRKCLGSLVSPMFILTAAHCFKFGDSPKHVTVEIDDGNGKVKRVKTFMLHPKYNINGRKKDGVEEFYDYDVALIQLEEAVQISTDVRPICIPGTQETSDALQLVGDSTLKQQEQLLLSNHVESVSFLSKSKQTLGRKDAIIKLGNNRGECIRHALQAKGITTTDVKVPVTDNFLCTGGLTPFRDHIACGGDSGGAVFKDYVHRTIQVGVVSWGTKNLCETQHIVESDETSRDFHINLFKVVPFLKSVLANDTQNDFVPLQFLKA